MIDYLTRLGARAFSTLVCLSLVVWSLMPVTSHTPAVIETVQDQVQMVADHGHSHGLEEDLIWALHGHGHDVADHDHGSAVLSRAAMPFHGFGYTTLGNIISARLVDTSLTPPKRPPRV